MFLLRMMSAAMTPGTQPQSVSRSTMSIDPQPRSITASGGKIMARMTWRQDMGVFNYQYWLQVVHKRIVMLRTPILFLIGGILV